MQEAKRAMPGLCGAHHSAQHKLHTSVTALTFRVVRVRLQTDPFGTASFFSRCILALQRTNRLGQIPHRRRTVSCSCVGYYKLVQQIW